MDLPNDLPIRPDGRAGWPTKILKGIATGEHTERSLILDLALALAEDRRRDISRKTRDGLESARRQGRTGGRPRVVDDDNAAPSSPAAPKASPCVRSPAASASASPSSTERSPPPSSDPVTTDPGGPHRADARASDVASNVRWVLSAIRWR
ncbi:hypothetical protein NBRGN_057_02900 [Nocardia brasiliensis NBRC 14402]|nr:hypothetical protein NBRGN_057_02900 [Nocardia brasiliensis NBRC 14402]